MPSLFEPQVAQEIIARINQLQPTTQRKWGKMNAAQMLKHCTDALGTATGDVIIKPPFIFKIIAPLIKKKVMEQKPYKEGLPTATEFIVKDYRNFEEEKASYQNASINSFQMAKKQLMVYNILLLANSLLMSGALVNGNTLIII